MRLLPLAALAGIVGLAAPARALEPDCSVDLLDAGAGDLLGWPKEKLESYRFYIAHTGKAQTPHEKTEIFVKPECAKQGRAVAQLLRLPPGDVQPVTWKAPYGITVAVDRGLAEKLSRAMAAGYELAELIYADEWDRAAKRLIVPSDLDVNAVGHAARTETPLEHAISKGQRAFVKAFVERGALVDPPVGAAVWGRGSPLTRAAECKDPEIARILLDGGADPDSTTAEGMTSLARAAESYTLGEDPRLLELMKLLVQRGAHANAGKKPALCLGYPSAELRELLVAHGADVNVDCGPNSHAANASSAPLALAAGDGDVEAVKDLLRRGAKLDGDRVTALCLAAGEEHVDDNGPGRLEVFRLLLEKGADPNHACDPLGRAVRSSDRENSASLIRMLLARGAKLSRSGESLVLRATTREAASVLVAAGADVNAEDSGGNRPLHHARDAALVAYLVERGAKVDARNHADETPLVTLFTEWEGSEEKSYDGREAAPVLAALLAAKADPNAADGDGMTPLHWAAKQGDADAVQALLAAGASPHARNKAKLTPRGVAAAEGAKECVRLLEAAEAKKR
jgi:ankyrin repeat protein